MTRAGTGRRVVGPLAVVVLLLAGCGSSGASPYGGGPGAASSPSTRSAPADSGAAAATMTISNFAFSSTTVPAGTTVTVTNDDPVEHTVTIADVGIDVKVPASGQATFTAPAAPGTYRVTCDFHANMKGGLTVT